MIGSIEHSGVHCTFASAAHSIHRTSISLFPSYPIMSPSDLKVPRLMSSKVDAYGLLGIGDVIVTDVVRVLQPRDLMRLSGFVPGAWDRF